MITQEVIKAVESGASSFYILTFIFTSLVIVVCKYIYESAKDNQKSIIELEKGYVVVKVKVEHLEVNIRDLQELGQSNKNHTKGGTNQILIGIREIGDETQDKIRKMSDKTQDGIRDLSNRIENLENEK